MSSAILTIVIPTYNRCNFLSLLLKTLVVELRGLEEKVLVVVGDNASSDQTSVVTDEFFASYSGALILRHSENMGAEENFCTCIDKVKTPYFWIIGDDDLPKSGVVRKVVNLLEADNADIVYLRSEWMSCIKDSDSGVLVSAVTDKILSRDEFARQVNVWVTFISGMIINVDRLYELNPDLDIRRFSGTHLVQLGWVLPLLMTGKRFKIVNQKCILATGANSGGYKLLNVFGTSFPLILDEICGAKSRECKAIKKSLSWSFIPGLLWASRIGRTSGFLIEDALKSVAPLKFSPSYWLVLYPLAKFPIPFAIPSLLVSRLFSLYGLACDVFAKK